MKTKLAITLASSALLAGGVASGADQGAAKPAANGPAIRAAQLAAMNKAEVKKLLERVAAEAVPKAANMGAMCYKMAAPPERFEYVCPTCAEKTLYAREVSWAWTYELDRCRRVFKEIPNREAMALDESAFCKHCQPKASEPHLTLLVRFDDGTSHRTSKVTSEDLRLLRDFLGKKLLVAGAQDQQTPIKEKLPRVRELLGMAEGESKP